MTIELPPKTAARRASLVAEVEQHRLKGREHEHKAISHYASAERCEAEIAAIDRTAEEFAELWSSTSPVPMQAQNIMGAGTIAGTPFAADADAESSMEGNGSEEPQKRIHRPIRKMVLETLKMAPLGMTNEGLVKKLDITRAQADAALTYHDDKKNVRHKAGVWYYAKPEEPAEVVPEAEKIPPWAQPQEGSNGGVNLNHGSGFQPGQIAEAAAAQALPLQQVRAATVADIIARAGNTGMSDAELAEQGIPFVEVSKAAKAGFIYHQDGRYHVMPGTPPTAA